MEAGSPAASKPRPRSRLEPKGKTDADVALEALVGHEIYVYGTGTAREMRQDGVLRKVGDQVRVESRGALMGFNEFCASAQNSKKRPRQTIHLSGTGLSLKQTTEEILGLTTQALGHDSSSSDDEGRQRPGSTTGSAGRAGSHDSKRPKTSNASSGGAAFAGNLELLKSSHDYADESEVLHWYNQPRRDLTLINPAKRRISSAAHKDAEERRIQALAMCRELLQGLMSTRAAASLMHEEDSTRGLGWIKARLDQDELPTHADFAQAIRKALSPCTEEEEEEERPGGEQARKLVLKLFEEKYLVLADQMQLADELAVCRFLPRPLHEMPQRGLQGWCIMDNKGQYLAPWHASHASSPGGVFGTLVPAPPAPGRLKDTDQGAQDKQDWQGEEDAESDAEKHAAPLKVRLNAPDEWQAQCLDPTGCALPQYWLRGGASTGSGSKLGPRGGPGKVWYQLGTPAEGYQEFLRSESCWLMGSWRIAHFLHAAPKSTFNEVVEVLAGRNWAAEAQSACEGKGEAVGEAKRLDQLPLQDVLEKADHVIDELSNVYPKLASHKFCNSLMARHHKYVRRKARGLSGAQISSLRMMGGGGLFADRAAASGGSASGTTGAGDSASNKRRGASEMSASEGGGDEAGGAHQRCGGLRDTEAGADCDKSSCASPASFAGSSRLRRLILTPLAALSNTHKRACGRR